MKLTEEGIEFAGIFYDIEELEKIFQNLPKLHQNQKLRELIKNEGELQSIINECQDTDGYISVKHLKEKLLEENKK